MSFQSEKDLSCPVCHDIFKDPVVLPCSHSFCKDCLKRWWSEKQIPTCPLCKKCSFFNDPPCNLVLKNLCEAFLLEKHRKVSSASEESEPLCSLHAEKLKLFCLDHQQPVCLICRDSKAHDGHRFRPIDEAAEDHRQELMIYLIPSKDKLKLLEEVKGNFDQTAEHIKFQAKRTERQIVKHFDKLRQFLKEEQEARISALRSEEEQKTMMMKKKTDTLSGQIKALSDTIRFTEKVLKAENVSFLQNYSDAEMIKYCHLLDDVQPVSVALIDEAKHLGNLTFNIWSKMKEMVSFSPVILDPNTAHPELILSEDLTSVTSGQRQKLPDNPERFDQHCCVLGSEGFDSGTHSWDVEVRNEQFWGVGVVKKSIERKGEIQTGYWEICLIDGKYKAVSPPLPDKVLLVKKLERVRVQLDWDRGRVIFIDLDTKKHIYTFKHTFNEELFPYIGTKHELPFKIIPMSISVTEQHEVTVSTSFWGF
ncbi:E3 ubiquitin-protein ligase TRIM35-like [Leuresthes tenuis]|uniref:E3 ubiquitin-protein ligase TRIM35-like n=1 Tax=Leuresthes tenuis TaxID=355514 RepID=UPI003B50A6C3